MRERDHGIWKKLHPKVTNISKTLHFRFIQLITYMIFIIDHIHHLMNESKILIFAYNSDQMVYIYIGIWYGDQLTENKECCFHFFFEWKSLLSFCELYLIGRDNSLYMCGWVWDPNPPIIGRTQKKLISIINFALFLDKSIYYRYPY
jgi:hypothetical protein